MRRVISGLSPDPKSSKILNLKKQMPKNLGMNILSFVTNVLIGLWLIPYLVKHIGVAAYGLVPLAMFFSEYVGIIIQSLNSAISRFLLIALQKKDYFQANEIFNTSLVIMFIFSLLQIIFMVIVVFDISFFINVPEELKSDAIWLFSFTFAGFSLSLFRAVFTTPLYSYNRTDLIQMSAVMQTLLRVIIIVLLFTVDEPLLKYVGIANFSASLFSFLFILYLSKKMVPELKFNVLMFNIKRVKDLTSMGGWVLVNQVGSLLFLKIDLYIVNAYLGAYQAGEYAMVMQWNNLIRAMIGVFAGIISPVLMIYYARNEIVKLVDLSKISVKLLGLLLAVPLGLICALAGDILSLWVGEEFRYLEGLMILSLAPLVINLAVLPLFTINTAYNRVKLPGIITIVLGVISFGFAILLVTQTNLGIYGVLLAGVIILTLKNVIFIPIYSAYILNASKLIFIKSLVGGTIAFLFVFTVAKIGGTVFVVNSFIKLVILFCITILITFPIITFFLLSKNDKEMISIIMPAKIRHIVNILLRLKT